MLETARVLQDRYRLDRALGKAAGRQTWLATDLTCQEAVVVKLLTFSDQVQWDNLRLFEREAAILKQLDHPRIPQYCDRSSEHSDLSGHAKLIIYFSPKPLSTSST